MGERVAKRRRRGTRYKARRRAVDFLFEAEARDLDPVAIVEDRIDLSRDQANQVAPVKDYTQQIVSGVAEELDGVDLAISRYLADEWELDRLPAVDRAILRVAVWELLYNDDVPAPAAVTQGVELASEYSNDSAAAYINAVLDDVAHHAAELRDEAARLAESLADPEGDDGAAASDAPHAEVDGASEIEADQAHASEDREPVPGDPETTGPFGESRLDTGIEAVGVEGVEPHHASSAWPTEGQAQGVNAGEPRADED